MEKVKDRVYSIDDLEEAFDAGCAMICAYEGDGEVDYDNFNEWSKKHKDYIKIGDSIIDRSKMKVGELKPNID